MRKPETMNGGIMPRIQFVRAEWDEEARVWVATSDDVPGLVTEADTVEDLEKAQNAYPRATGC